LKFVLDTNVFLKALIKNSTVRGIIMGSNHEFLVPAHLIDETREHLDEVEEKSGLSRSEIESVLDALLGRTRFVEEGQVLSRWREAEKAMNKVDEDDVPFVAAALAARCDGIWSDDRHLKRQSKVRVWTTREVVRLGGRA
jgi:predicted nucleic acid-binding protein